MDFILKQLPRPAKKVADSDSWFNLKKQQHEYKNCKTKS